MIWLGPLLAAAIQVAKTVSELANRRPGQSARVEDQIGEMEHPLGDYLIQGQATFGWRVLGVGGSRAQFDEDLGLTTGPLIRDFSLAGRRGSNDGWIRGWSMDASGIGDPSSSARAEIETADTRILGRYQRSSFTGTSDSDIHSFDITRERASLGIASKTCGGKDLQAGIDVYWEHSDSLQDLSRSVDFAHVSPVPSRIESQTLGVRGNLGYNLDEWDLLLGGGVAWSKNRDRREFAQPSPSDPNTIQTEDFAADLEGVVLDGSLRASHSPTDRLELDLGASAANGDSDGDLSDFESGVLFAPGDDFTRDTQGDANLSSSQYKLDAGLRYEVSEDLCCFARAWNVNEREQAHLDRHVVLTEMGTPSTLDVSDRSHYDSDLYLVEAGCETSLAKGTDLTVTARAGRESVNLLETAEGVVTRQFDGELDRYGAEATLTLRPSSRCTCSVGGGWGIDPAQNSSSGTELAFANDVGAHVEGSVRWRTGGGTSWAATLSHREAESRAFESRSMVDAVGICLTGSPQEGLNAQGQLTLRRVDLRADTTELINLVQVPVTLEHDVLQLIASGSVAWQPTPNFDPSLSLTLAVSTGDTDFTTAATNLDLPIRVGEGTKLGVAMEAWVVESSSSVDLSNYKAISGIFYVRTSF